MLNNVRVHAGAVECDSDHVAETLRSIRMGKSYTASGRRHVFGLQRVDCRPSRILKLQNERDPSRYSNRDRLNESLTSNPKLSVAPVHTDVVLGRGRNDVHNEGESSPG